jgi:hypothetical protein
MVRGCAIPALRAMAVIAIVSGSAASAPRPAFAQTAPDGASVTVAPGSRIRVATPATGRIVGTLLSATSDSLHLEVVNGSSIAFPVASVSQLELSAGVRRNGWKGAGIGLLAGAGVGGVIGLATYRRTECDEPVLELFVCSFIDQTSRNVTVVADAALAGTVGAVVGALIGHVGRESWVRVPLARDGVRVGLATTTVGSRRGIGIGVVFQ